jgi:uroporphyrinogen decarboxylase
MPRFAEKIKLVHDAGVKCGYTMSTGVMHLISCFKELGFEILWYVDPVQGGANLERLKAEMGNKLCFLGGVNGALTVGHGTEEEVRNAVREAIQILGPGGGLILNAADAIYRDAPWNNVISMIQAWRNMGEYRLRT